MRCAYVSIYRDQQQIGHRGARGYHQQDRGRPDLLLQPARDRNRKSGSAYRERVLPRSIEPAADGIRCRSTKTACGEPGRFRWINKITIMLLSIKNLRAGIPGKEILQGINLDVKAGEVHAIMGPNGSGKSTLSSVLAGKEDYEVTGGEVTFNGKDLLELSPEDRA